MTYRDYLLMSEGYNDKQQDVDHKVRLLAYMVVKPYLKDQKTSIYEFMPLPGDPTPEEIAAIEQANLEKEMQEAKIEYERVKKEFSQWRASQ